MEVPEFLDHFQILREADGQPWELGHGTMGITYKAFDTRLHVTVALKILRPEITRDARALEQFRREARAAARLQHPHIVGVQYFGEAGGFAFYVMEFCAGPTVYALVAGRGPLAEREALVIAWQVARALVVAEQNKIIHRDLKPTNLILANRPDEKLTVKVIDFGLACTYGEDSAGHDTDPQEAFTGTVWFASPEQLQEQPLDIRSDFYALGACLWFMLTGRPVFEGSTAEIMAATLTQPPPLDRLPQLSSGVRAMVGSLLAKDVALRPASALALCSGIEACLQAISPVPASGEAAPPPPPATNSPKPRPVPPGEILARFSLGAQFDTHPCWTAHHAVDIASGVGVHAYILRPAVAEVPSVVRELDHGLGELAAHPHPHLAAVLAYGQTARGWLIITEETGPLTALQVLRTRGEVKPGEAIRILTPIASALDHLEASAPSRQSVNLATIHLDPGGAVTPEVPLARWPTLTVKLLALGTENLLSGQSMETISPWNAAPAGGGGTANSPVPTPTAQLAAAFYALVGGNLSRPGQFVTLPQLPEEANRLLAEATRGRAATASQWIADLKSSLGTDVQEEEPVQEDGRPPIDAGGLHGDPRPGIPWKWMLAAVPVVAICLAAGWLATTFWQSRHQQDPRAPDKSISILEDILRRRQVMRSTLNRIETIQMPELQKARQFAAQSPHTGWEDSVRILEEVIEKRKADYRQDRNEVDRYQNEMLNAWEAYPDSYEEALQAICDDAPKQRNQEMADLARDFLDRFGQLGKDPDRQHGHDRFLDRVCQTQNNSE